MKITLSWNSKIAKICLWTLVVAVVLILSRIAPGKNDALISYHESKWNEYAIDVERAFIVKKDTPPAAELEHVYGIVLPHHIPTTIEGLIEYYVKVGKTQTVRRIIIVGPDHTDSGIAPVTTSNTAFVTRFATLKPIPGLATELQEKGLAHIEENPFINEHSIGAQVLVISKVFPKAEITPIIIRSDAKKSKLDAIAVELAKNLDENTILVASVDFSHYLPTAQAVPIDHISGEVVKNLDLDAISLIEADSSESMTVFMKTMVLKKANQTDSFKVENTNDLMQNSDYTTGYVFGLWGVVN
jgi:MEMO1 family protein